MYKSILGSIKLKIYPNKATPAPPVGPSLGQKGLNIIDFCKKFNNFSSKIESTYLIPVLITYYSDKSYDFFIKKPTINFYLKNIKTNIFNSNHIDFLFLLEIVKFKIIDLNTSNIFSSIKIIIGVLKSMNIFLNFNFFLNE
ncbi:50S ribosomal protein L11 [Candidatus Nasuia deltocephalinicola]|uniref:Large ribosomal subunit protein uL11 n=1 Tax=Candidatus Nasuia deltocephalincola TaxID=1160784 RepID=A0A974WKP2_9PROT|nr:50S ribosomal protein L11 [Candidatus Nasuia deltocephalinicola]